MVAIIFSPTVDNFTKGTILKRRLKVQSAKILLHQNARRKKICTLLKMVFFIALPTLRKQKLSPLISLLKYLYEFCRLVHGFFSVPNIISYFDGSNNIFADCTFSLSMVLLIFPQKTKKYLFFSNVKMKKKI